MKRLMVFALIVSCVSVLGADAAPVVVPAVDGSVNWLSAISRVFIDILPIIGTALSILAVYGAKLLLTKMKLDALAANTDLLNSVAATGVHYAEEWASKQAVKPTGSAKMDQALTVIEGVIGTPAFQQMGKDQLAKIVDSVVSKNINGPTAPVTAPVAAA